MKEPVTTEGMKQALAYLSPIVERVSLGIVAGGGLIVAACLSALPAASCTAMAQTYFEAILTFGAPAIFSLIALVISPSGLTYDGRLTYFSSFRSGMILGIVVALSYLFVGAALAGIDNLNHATRFCFVGTSKQLSSQAHEMMHIERPWEGWGQLRYDLFGF